MGSFFDFLDSSEGRCVTGLGMSALGIGLGAPIAAKACTEVVEKVEDRLEDQARAASDFLRDKICEAEPFVGSGMFPLLFGPAFPVTTLTVPFSKLACGDSSILPDISASQFLSAIVPFGGPGAVLAYGLYRELEAKPDPKEVFRKVAEDLVGGMMLMGAAKALKRVELRQLKRIDHALSPEMREQLKQAMNKSTQDVQDK